MSLAFQIVKRLLGLEENKEIRRTVFDCEKESFWVRWLFNDIF